MLSLPVFPFHLIIASPLNLLFADWRLHILLEPRRQAVLLVEIFFLYCFYFLTDRRLMSDGRADDLLLMMGYLLMDTWKTASFPVLWPFIFAWQRLNNCQPSTCWLNGFWATSSSILGSYLMDEELIDGCMLEDGRLVDGQMDKRMFSFCGHFHLRGNDYSTIAY